LSGPPGERGTLLALDTSGPHGSVAVGHGSEVIARSTVAEPREHASRLVPTIEGVLREASLPLERIGGVVVGEGPGSFTGVRVAAATAKGLVHALGIPLWAVSSLTAAALAAEGMGSVRYVLFDARGDRVYGACYGVGSAGVEELVAPHGGTLRDALDDVPAGAVFTGDGSERHRALIEAAGFPVEPAREDSLAVGLLRYLDLHRQMPPVEDPAGWEPAYVRASSAERPWSR
jgi:tRNA threonylcarbamoyladenosine biosynthesis protein TsaB